MFFSEFLIFLFFFIIQIPSRPRKIALLLSKEPVVKVDQCSVQDRHVLPSEYLNLNGLIFTKDFFLMSSSHWRQTYKSGEGWIFIEVFLFLLSSSTIIVLPLYLIYISFILILQSFYKISIRLCEQWRESNICRKYCPLDFTTCR